MANAAKINALAPVRMMIVGFPGSAKTGSLAALANAGYKIRMIDYDGNIEPLIKFTHPDKLHNIDIVNVEDKLRMGGNSIQAIGVPSAFANGLKLMDEWKYTEPDGTVVSLGSSKDWGCDTVVVLDSLTSMGAASFRRVQNMLNKTPINTTQQVWGISMAEQEAFIEKLTSSSNRFHVIVLAHLKMISPKDAMNSDSDLTKELKERAADIIPTKFYPSALGQQLPPLIGQHFPTLIQAEKKFGPGTKVAHVLRTVSKPELDIKVPTAALEAELPIDTGLLTIFKALAPPLETCLEGPVGSNPAASGEKKETA